MYLASARGSEAVQMVGAIANGAISSYERQRLDQEQVAEGKSSLNAVSSADKVTGSGNGATVTHRSGVPFLCGSADPVPASLASVKGRKYQPRSSPGKDYATGDSEGGWTCLMFSNSHPQSYQLEFTSKAGAPVSVVLPKGGSPPGLTQKKDTWSVIARGDTDGDGIQASFVATGEITNGNIKRATSIAETDPYE